ncbi:MFS transporter [Cysteiniphilum halobium]|uniref:MFS transporter n=1 Tax=Cysteiniphilum halobium TaxID=2219059 RepID=UPI003F835DEA
MPTKHVRVLSFVLLTWFLGNLNVYFFMPFLPLIKHDFTASALLTQYVISIFYICKAAGMLVFGSAAEIIGRRKIMLIGIFMIAAASFVSLFVENMETLLICRMFQGLGVSATVLMGRTMINDLYQDKKAARIFSVIMILACIITLLPIFGGYLTRFDSYRLPFAIIMIYTLIIGIFSYLLLPETKKTTHKSTFKVSHIFRYYFYVIKERSFLAFILCTIFVVAGESAFDTASPLLMMQTYHFSPTAYGYFVSIMSMVSWFGILGAGLLLKRYSLEAIMGIGAIASLIAGVLIISLFFTPNLMLFVISMVIFFFGSGFILTIFNVGVVKNHQQTISIASSASLFLYFSCSALGSFIISHFSTATLKPLASAMFILCLLVFVVWVFLIMPLMQTDVRKKLF